MNKYYAALKKAEKEIEMGPYSIDLENRIWNNCFSHLTTATNWCAGNQYLGDSFRDMSTVQPYKNNKQRKRHIELHAQLYS